MIDREHMLRLERKAALELTEPERTETIVQMNAVLSCLGALHHHPDLCPQDTTLCHALRTDEVLTSADRTALLANAPETDGEFFLVPRTVE